VLIESTEIVYKMMNTNKMDKNKGIKPR